MGIGMKKIIKILKNEQKWINFIDFYNKKYTKPFGKTNNVDTDNRIISDNIKVSQIMPGDKLNQSVFIANSNPNNILNQFIMPNLRRSENSYVIVDNDDLNINLYEKFFTDNGYEIKRYDPSDLAESITYDPIEFINDDRDESIICQEYFFTV